MIAKQEAQRLVDAMLQQMRTPNNGFLSIEEATGKPYNPTGPAIFGQDSAENPYIIAKPNEQFLEVHVWSRYYGEDYARGDWKTLSFILMWCVFNIPDDEHRLCGLGRCVVSNVVKPMV